MNNIKNKKDNIMLHSSFNNEGKEFKDIIKNLLQKKISQFDLMTGKYDDAGEELAE